MDYFSCGVLHWLVMSYTHLITREPPSSPSPPPVHICSKCGTEILQTQGTRCREECEHRLCFSTVFHASFSSLFHLYFSICLYLVIIYLFFIFLFILPYIVTFITLSFHTCVSLYIAYTVYLSFSYLFWFVFLHWSYLEASLIVLTWNVSVGFSESSPPVNLFSMIWLNKLSPSKQKL